jgi:hypothetical protein
MVPSNYIGSTCDCHMDKEEYTAYEAFMKGTFHCILCEVPHSSKEGQPHSLCQIDDSQDYPEDWSCV